MEKTDTRDILGENAAKLGLAQIQRHLFLCCDQTKPKCCDKEEGLEVWDYLKKRLSELELDRPVPTVRAVFFALKPTVCGFAAKARFY